MGRQHHKCPRPEKGALPQKISASAWKGSADEVMSWVKNGGDISAADMYDRTLLFIACSRGHVLLVRELLKHQGVHLNQLAKHTSTPLAEAACNGHVDCVEAIISSTAECQVEYEFKRNGQSAVMGATMRKQWRIVETFLRAQKVLCPSDLKFIIGKSVDDCQWDIARDAASFLTSDKMTNVTSLFTSDNKTNVASPVPLDKKTKLCTIISKIYEKDKWDYLSATELFRLMEFHDIDDGKFILCRMLKNRDWKRLTDAFRVLYEDVEVDISLAEAILEKKDEETQRLLARGQLDSAAKNGTLLVAALGGTSDTVARLLFDLDYGYPDAIMKNALILTCLSKSPSLLQVLLEGEKYSYKTLTRGHAITKAKNCRLLMKRAVQREEKNIIPLPEDSEDDFTDDDADDESMADTNGNHNLHIPEFMVPPHNDYTDMELFEALLANMQQNLPLDGIDDDDDDDYDDDDDDEDDDYYDDTYYDDWYDYGHQDTQCNDVRINVCMQSKAGLSDGDDSGDDSDDSDD